MRRSFPPTIYQASVDVASELIVPHDVYNDANDSQLLHPMAVAAKAVLEVDQLQVLTDGGYSNAEEVARCERENIEVAAPNLRAAATGLPCNCAISAIYRRPAD